MNTNEINAMKNELNALKEKAKNLEMMITKAEKTAEPVFNRLEKGEVYYTILTTTGGLTVYPKRDTGETSIAGKRYLNNNYFYTEDRGEEVVFKLNFMLRLERLHDIYCPNYVPNWSDINEKKYGVYYSEANKEYVYAAYTDSSLVTVYFPTPEIAKRVCEILTEKRKEDDKHQEDKIAFEKRREQHLKQISQNHSDYKRRVSA